MAARPERIVLVGLPGSGKSTVAPILAQRLGWRLIDLDALIETEAGQPIAGIFARDGEAVFRRIEGELTERLASESRFVLSPGGGWFLHHDLPGSLVVWLQVDAGEAVTRIGSNAALRPLLQPDPLQRMRQLLAEREPSYRRADLVVDTNGKSPDTVAALIVGAIDEMYGNQEE